MSDRWERLWLIGRIVFADRRRAGAVMAISVATGVTASLVAVLIKVVIDAVVAGQRSTAVAASLALAVVWTASGGAATWASLLLADLHESAGRALSTELMALMAAPPGIEHHERPDYLDRVALLRRSARLLSGMLRTLSDLANLVLRVASTALVLATVDWRLALVAVFALPSVAAGARARRITEAADEAVAARGRLADNLLKVSIGPTAGEVRVLGLGEEITARVSQLWEEIHKVTERAQARASLVRVGGWLTFAAGYVGAVALTVGRALDGQATAGDVAMVVTLVSQVNGQVGQTVAVLTQSLDANRAAHRLQWLHRYAAGQPVDADRPLEQVPARLGIGIALVNVTFRYPGTDRDVLEGITLDLPAGATVALVGENGAGKTTLVKLLCRFYEPTAGGITVDGVELSSFSPGRWREHVTAGFQDSPGSSTCCASRWESATWRASTTSSESETRCGAWRATPWHPLTPSSASSGAASSSPPISGRRSPSLGRPCRPGPCCSCLTSPPPASTPTPSTSFSSATPSLPVRQRGSGARSHCWSPTASRPSGWPT